MSSLATQRPSDTFGFLFQVDGGLTSGLKTIQDGSGNNTTLQLSNATINITSGLTVSGSLAAASFTGAGTSLTGTASSLTAGHVTTNANLTGPITSSGNATSVASQTGTGSKFVMDTSPTLITPALGTPASGVLTNCTGSAAGLTAGHVAAITMGAIADTAPAGMLYGDGSSVNQDSHITTNGSGSLSISKDLDVGAFALQILAGATSLDNGAITTDGTGTLTINPTFGGSPGNSLIVESGFTSLDAGAITTSGFGTINVGGGIASGTINVGDGNLAGHTGTINVYNGDNNTITLNGSTGQITTGNLIAIAITIGSGTSSLDSGAITTDGSGNLAVSASVNIGDGHVNLAAASSLDSGAITTDGSGTLTAVQFVGGGAGITGITATSAIVPGTSVDTATAGMLYGDGSFVQQDSGITTDGSGTLTAPALVSIGAGVGLSVGMSGGGTTSLDSGAITTDGAGNLHSTAQITADGGFSTGNTLQVTGTSHLDNNLISTDGSGVLTAVQFTAGAAIMTNSGFSNTTGTLTIGGTTSLDAGAITTDGAGTLNVGGTVGGTLNVKDGTAITRFNVDSNGSLIALGSITFSNLPTADPTTVGQLWNSSGVLMVSAG